MRPPSLELISHTPTPESALPHAPALLFVHGAYTGAWCWEEHFLPYFAQAGYAAHALSLSGHAGSPAREYLDTYSISQYVQDVTHILKKLDQPTVVIGHSMGGFVAQKLLETAIAQKLQGLVLLCSVPPTGLMHPALHTLLRAPNLMSDLSRFMTTGQAPISSWQKALFHQPIPEENLIRYGSLAQPESWRAIWDMTFFNPVLPYRSQTLKTLVVGAEYDLLIPPEAISGTARAFGTEGIILPDLGHAIMLERDWHIAAGTLLNWLGSI